MKAKVKLRKIGNIKWWDTYCFGCSKYLNSHSRQSEAMDSARFHLKELCRARDRILRKLNCVKCPYQAYTMNELKDHHTRSH